MASQSTGSSFSRRGFLGIAGGVAATAALAACSTGGGSGGSAKAIKFWNMPWGGTEFNPLDKKITVAYKPKSGMGAATYQEIQWANFTQTFSSAVASNTGPAVSSGGGTQAFQFAEQGKIAYADNLIDSWKKNGIYDDFFDGLVDTLKTDKGYAAVPYNLDVRISWYNKTLMQEAGVESPTDWDSYRNVCAALKKNGVYGFGLGSGAGSFTGSHILTAFMINNGGGLFNADKKPDCVTPENIEAMDFILDLVKSGYSDPASATYTSANVQSQWKAKKFGFGWDGAGLAAGAVGDVAGDLVVGSPLTSPSGKKGGLYFPNNIMMYKKTGIGLPPLKSISETPEFQADPNNVKIIKEWQPIFKTWAAPGGSGLFYNIANTVDGTAPMITFAQTILGGNTTSKAALTALQTSMEGLMK
jgi:multiple sugar transport system substrate-binding protein